MKRSTFALLAVTLFGCTEPTIPATSGLSQLHPAFSVVAAPNEVVLPSAYTSLMGESNNSFPHAQNNLRYQQVFLGSDIHDPTIVGVCLRRDDLFGGNALTQTLTIKLGPTSLDYTNLGRAFDSNYSAPPTQVFSGDVAIPASAGGGTPTDFDFCIPFTQQYVQPVGSNVIIEVINSSLNSGDQPRDACEELAGCTTSRAFAFSTTADNAALVARGGLVMKFVSPAPPAPTDPTTSDDCKKGGWADFGFTNQGQCVRFVETGLDSRS
jgi:hypothetical protein